MNNDATAIVLDDEDLEDLGGYAERTALSGRCRIALAAFLWLDPDDRAALGRWLVGEYAEVVRSTNERVVTVPPESAAVAAWPLSEVVRDAQREVTARLALLGEHPTMGAVADSIAARHVVRNATGWVPVDRLRMKLTHRVVSLIAAAHLNDIDDLFGVAPMSEPAGPARPRSGFMFKGDR